MNAWKLALAACGVAALLAGPAWARPTVYPTGTTIFQPEKAMPDVFIMAVHPDRVSIIDRNGNEYNSCTVPAIYQHLRARLDENGNLLLAGTVMDMSSAAALTEEHPTYIAEYDWNGKKLWEHKVPDGLDWHNDVTKLKNGNILYTAYTVIPEEYQKQIKDVELPWGTF